jgi:hypothetical protein
VASTWRFALLGRSDLHFHRWLLRVTVERLRTSCGLSADQQPALERSGRVVDLAGAGDLSAGLGLPLEPGLIYAGLAGATRWPSGRRSTNTLWSRVAGMHLGGRHEFCTFRRSLGLDADCGGAVVPAKLAASAGKSH